jgi:hypothetical protein
MLEHQKQIRRLMMKNHSSITWFVRGFVATLFIVMLVFYASVGLTQEENPLVESNLGEVSEQSNTTTTMRTDDPLGRVQIPFADETLPSSNIDASMLSDSDDANVAPQTAVQLEEQLIADDYVSPLVIPAADFTADGANPDSLYFPFSGGYFQGDSENYGCMVAPAYLPDGATITDMFATVYDDDTTYNFSISLRRVDNFAGGTDTMATASSSGDYAGLTTINDATIDDPLIVSPDYSYYVTTCALSGNMRLYSVRLYYTS